MTRIRTAIAVAALFCATTAFAQTPAPGAPELEILADQVTQALLVNDASRLPLAKDFRYTENGSPLEIGDGMWRTLSAYAGLDPRIAPASAPLKFRFDVVDRQAGQILAYRAIDENGTSGVLVLRLKVKNGLISEMEAITIHQELLDPRGGTVTLLQPRLLEMLDPAKLGAIDPVFAAPAPADRASLIAAANAYLDGQVANSSARIPFSADCVRRDNGNPTTGDPDAAPLDPEVPSYKPFSLGCARQIDSGLYRYIARVRDRRFLVDEQRGLVAAIDLMDVPGTLHEIDIPGTGRVRYPGPDAAHSTADDTAQFNDFAAANLRVPSSMLAIHLFKIVDGKIVRMEDFERGAHLGFEAGW